MNVLFYLCRNLLLYHMLITDLTTLCNQEIDNRFMFNFVLTQETDMINLIKITNNQHS